MVRRRSLSGQQALGIVSVLLIVVGFLVASLGLFMLVSEPRGVVDVFVGLDIGYGDEETALRQIDRVAGFVNLIILGSLDVTTDDGRLTRVCDYICEKGLHFIVYVGFGEGAEDAPPSGPGSDFFAKAVDRYGEKFRGVYLFDEVGGKLMDGAHSVNMTAADSYSEAAILYTHHLNYYLGNVSRYYAPAEFRLYMSDYALYWFDYLAGYDVVFTEYVGDHSRLVATGLCRGAAKVFNKEWGVMLTWSHRLEPFVENPDQLYDDMVFAYENGAKYIVVFNSPGENSPPTEYGTLTPAHFDKMREFWRYVHACPRAGSYPADAAFVLPRDYGFGFRAPGDKIWGKWEADSLSSVVWGEFHRLVGAGEGCLDIVYETRIDDEPVSLPYGRLFFWNGTVVQK